MSVYVITEKRRNKENGKKRQKEASKRDGECRRTIQYIPAILKSNDKMV